jgi:signal transduction histidine kinase
MSIVIYYYKTEGSMRFKKIIRENLVQLLVIFLMFLFIITFGCIWAAFNVRNYMVSTVEEMLKVAEERIQARLGDLKVTLMNTSIYLEQQYLEQGASPKQIEDYLAILDKNFRADKEYILGYHNIYLYLPKEEGGRFLNGAKWERSRYYMPESRPWYVIANASPGTMITTPPYRDQITGVMVIGISMMLRDGNNETYGYLTIDIALETIADYVLSFQFERGGYGFMLGPKSEFDSSLCFIAYPDVKYKWIPLREMGPQYQKLERELLLASEKISSMSFINKENTTDIVFFRKTFNGWYAGLAFQKSDYFHDVYIMAFIYIFIGLVLALIMCYYLLRLSLAKKHSDEENKAKSSFLAQVSHEIRTPLNSILGMSEILQRKNISAEIYEDVSIIKQAGNILLSIINNILDFSKIQTNKVIIETHPYNLASMMNDVVNVIRLRLMDKPVDFFVNLDSKIPAELIGDELKIRQLLINLLNNAVKYTQTGYIKLSVEIEFLNINTIKLIFSIEDTGIGIKKEDMAILFQDFTRVDTEHNYGI